VVGGLSEGDQVVTRALFLVDSESQLKAAIAGMVLPVNTNTEHQPRFPAYVRHSIAAAATQRLPDRAHH